MCYVQCTMYTVQLEMSNFAHFNRTYSTVYDPKYDIQKNKNRGGTRQRNVAQLLQYKCCHKYRLILQKRKNTKYSTNMKTTITSM